MQLTDSEEKEFNKIVSKFKGKKETFNQIFCLKLMTTRADLSPSTADLVPLFIALKRNIPSF